MSWTAIRTTRLRTSNNEAMTYEEAATETSAHRVTEHCGTYNNATHRIHFVWAFLSVEPQTLDGDASDPKVPMPKMLRRRQFLLNIATVADIFIMGFLRQRE